MATAFCAKLITATERQTSVRNDDAFAFDISLLLKNIVS